MKITELIDLTNSDKPIQIRLLELHSPIFLAGTNLGAKLDVSRRTGLEIIYYKRVIYISYNDEASFFDALNAANIVPGTAKKAD
jgi:hypothetical protein